MLNFTHHLGCAAFYSLKFQQEAPNGKSSTSVLLTDALHAPDVGSTIVSISHTAKSGCSVSFEGDSCKIKNQRGALSWAASLRTRMACIRWTLHIDDGSPPICDSHDHTRMEIQKVEGQEQVTHEALGLGQRGSAGISVQTKRGSAGSDSIILPVQGRSK